MIDMPIVSLSKNEKYLTIGIGQELGVVEITELVKFLKSRKEFTALCNDVLELQEE